MRVMLLAAFVFSAIRGDHLSPRNEGAWPQLVRLPEDLVIVGKSNSTASRSYRLLRKKTARVKTFTRALLKRRLHVRNATRTAMHILTPKYRHCSLNVSEIVRRDISPLLVFVNRKSGGRRGREVLALLRQVLSEYQICDLSTEAPKTYVRLFKDVPSERLKVLCCGGDGSVQWVMNELFDAGLRNATFAILPLGTGNDLFTYLYGSNTSAAVQQFLERPQELLGASAGSFRMPLDRWGLSFRNTRRQSRGLSDSLVNVTAHPKKSILKSIGIFASKRRPRQVLMTMNNYFGIGVDGAISIQFHNARNSMPFFFFNSMVNKFWYACVSLTNLWSGGGLDLNKFIDIRCDGRKVVIPRQMQGIVMLNINSYAGGSVMWAPRNLTTWRPLSCSDGVAELVGVTGVTHLARIKAGLAAGIPIAQGRRISVTTKEYVPMQIDGEPWLQRPCRITIGLLDRVHVFAPSGDARPKGAQEEGGSISRSVIPLGQAPDTSAEDEDAVDSICESLNGFILYD